MSFNPELCRNESEVESKLIVQYLLPQLGYTPETWHQEVAFGNIRLDFLAFGVQVIPFTLDANSPLSIVMEAKHPKQNLNTHILRLKYYLTKLNVRYGLLTNGREIRIYEKKSQDEVQIVFQCLGKDVEANIDDIRKLIGRENINKIQTSENSAVKQTEIKVKTKERNMKVIAVYHNKGGVGKTTTVVNLAAALRKKGKQVLIIDLDSQANSTFATGLVKFDDEDDDDIKDSNILQVLQSEELYPISEVARKSNFCNPEIYVIPSHINLIAEERNLSELEHTKLGLLEKLNEVKDKYDVVLIDTPPSLNLYARIALITSDYVIIPSDLKPFANQGLTNVKEFIKKINAFRKQVRIPPLQILGVLPCKISTNHKFVNSTLRNRIEKIANKYDLDVLEAVIYEREDLAKCAERIIKMGDMEIADPISVMDFKPNSLSAQEFELLAKEVLNKIGMN
ncbi:AAA family ATPase [Calothrix sp. 336/3]|uniref:AAA family ATPase n=1 Tax=Calothrix sp. 336/3 TaxID=1337936 RepID=UPI0004E38EE0|nr:AAA family ATPase [Calothrix sp. 336/3]AKG24082.1 plasmid partitioning protein ParA [Calothrix sp. 336/3]